MNKKKLDEINYTYQIMIKKIGSIQHYSSVFGDIISTYLFQFILFCFALGSEMPFWVKSKKRNFWSKIVCALKSLSLTQITNTHTLTHPHSHPHASTHAHTDTRTHLLRSKRKENPGSCLHKVRQGGPCISYPTFTLLKMHPPLFICLSFSRSLKNVIALYYQRCTVS